VEGSPQLLYLTSSSKNIPSCNARSMSPLNHPNHMDARSPVRLAWMLHLLCAPSSISVSHIRWRLNLGQKFEGAVANAGYSNDASRNIAENMIMKNDRSDEDVDLWQ
jgi:hypothetical protein